MGKILIFTTVILIDKQYNIIQPRNEINVNEPKLKRILKISNVACNFRIGQKAVRVVR